MWAAGPARSVYPRPFQFPALPCLADAVAAPCGCAGRCGARCRRRQAQVRAEEMELQEHRVQVRQERGAAGAAGH